MQLFYSEEDGEYVALVPEFPYLSVLDKEPDKAVREAVMVAEGFLEDLAKAGQEAPDPQVLSGFSGQIRVRMPRTLHQKLAGRARMEDVSLNTLIVSLMAEGIGAMEELPLVERKARRPKRAPGGNPAAIDGERPAQAGSATSPGQAVATGEGGRP